MSLDKVHTHAQAIQQNRVKLTFPELNASMRRIDLSCKLFAPMFISLLDSLSSRAAIWTVLGLNATSVLVEYGAIEQVISPYP